MIVYTIRYPIRELRKPSIYVGKVYHYTCGDCGNKFSVNVWNKKCPACGSKKRAPEQKHVAQR